MSRRNAPVSARTATTISSTSSIGKSLHHRRQRRTVEAWLLRAIDPRRQHCADIGRRCRPERIRPPSRDARSEEHTSELPSLMRISYAVFCLTKKKTQSHKNEYSKHIYTH